MKRLLVSIVFTLFALSVVAQNEFKVDLCIAKLIRCDKVAFTCNLGRERIKDGVFPPSITINNEYGSETFYPPINAVNMGWSVPCYSLDFLIEVYFGETGVYGYPYRVTYTTKRHSFDLLDITIRHNLILTTSVTYTTSAFYVDDTSGNFIGWENTYLTYDNTGIEKSWGYQLALSYDIPIFKWYDYKLRDYQESMWVRLGTYFANSKIENTFGFKLGVVLGFN